VASFNVGTTSAITSSATVTVMTATPVMFFKVGTTYFNAAEIRQVVTRGDGTADLYYSGGSDRVKLNLGATEAAAITALNILLTPTDVTSYLT
jgi:hypothetical protein